MAVAVGGRVASGAPQDTTSTVSTSDTNIRYASDIVPSRIEKFIRQERLYTFAQSQTINEILTKTRRMSDNAGYPDQISPEVLESLKTEGLHPRRKVGGTPSG
jgi:hypothetical protein